MAFIKNIGLVGQIIVGLIVGALAGVLIPQATFLGLFGKAFIGALTAVAPTLVFILVISSLVSASNNLKGRFRKIVLLYMLSTLTAAVMAVFVSFLFQ